ncbi:hypothetical protein E2W16_03505 [Salmonella enterica]|uniref:Uncharacterized protein n=6 Tax=Salmonella enterica TaxID=28901 RepID=A0A5V7YV28_SALEB|nr:hypothetical protein [Salmonella enterica]EAA3946129.1 hypothetical protein [Salmonella enterica subsp. enterica serovar Java]EAB5778603.1 hypothetical protein [Salmonella enterica subsp. enterica serovar Stanley]EAC2048440.1 hypothetical protein [Salmonella enterica subsp. enterica serovar Braenderup]EBL5531997.1 hypothetical protein [Salmonella enterica subsp. enterica serovar Muenchen]EBM9898771.1 hypothetical protein [Salmonella enterica subsp. enterica serovar Typhimurium]EBS3059127.1
MAAFSCPATITPQTLHTRTTTPDHQRTDSDYERAVTTRSDDNFYYYAPPLARNAFPATPARFMGRF